MLNNVIVTGDRGFLGRHLCKKLTEMGSKIVGLNTSNCNMTENFNPANSKHNFGIKPDTIIHLAAWTRAGDFCLKYPGDQFIINQEINNFALKMRLFFPDANFIGMGTSCSYDENLPMIEDNYLKGNPEQSLFTYAMTKRMLLIGLNSLYLQYKLRYTYCVPSTLYGEDFDIDDNHFIFDLIRKIYRGKNFGEDVILWGDGHQKRELIYVGDAVDAIISMSSNHGVFNIGSGVEYSIREYAKMICEILGYDFSKIKYDTNRYVGVKSKKLIITKFNKELAKTSIQEGLEKTINYFINQNN